MEVEYAEREIRDNNLWVKHIQGSAPLRDNIVAVARTIMS